jgi:phosphatidylserine/phosphatidylglycerophosphate/cardiolipin synthase-like enzyme
MHACKHRVINAPGGVAMVAILVGVFVTGVLSGCSSSKQYKEERVASVVSYAEPPATRGLLAGLAAKITAEHGEEYSGFRILDASRAGLYWRLALIDSATTSLDIQTYLWYPDFSGKLILEHQY